jgi:hypothetical protein
MDAMQMVCVSRLTYIQSEYEKKLADLNTANRFKMKLAEEEHAALTKTLRDRLINSITSKKLRLEKEKGALDIADSNAVLLHPNQFGIHNPASPGGMHSKRATRNRRDADDISGFADSNKRKRKALDEDGSPAPTRRGQDNGTNTPVWNLDKAREAAKQFDTPLYSIEKLFTDRDLGMTYNNAAMAAYKYILDHPINDRNGVNSSSPSSDPAAAEGSDDIPDSPPTAPAMDRQPSHLTRSRNPALGTTNYLTPTSIEALSDLNPHNYKLLISQLPRLPPPISNITAKRYEKESANSPASVSAEELAADRARMSRALRCNDEGGEGANLDLLGDREVLDAACAPPGTWLGWFPASKGGGVSGSGVSGYSNMRDDGGSGAASGLGGTGMSRQGSGMGSEWGGGVPMSRSGTQEGSKRGRGRA